MTENLGRIAQPRLCIFILAVAWVLTWNTACSSRGQVGTEPDAGADGLADSGAGDAPADLDPIPVDGGDAEDAGPGDQGQEIPPEIANLVLHTWTPIAKNTLADVDPCPSRDCGYSAVEGQNAVLNDWTGGAFASEEGELGGLVYHGGGHNGYYGNEIYFFDLATLQWSLAIGPTIGQVPGDAATFDLDPESCLYYDGHPVAQHTYDSVVYIPSTRRFMLTVLGDVASQLPGSPTGCANSKGMFFDFVSKDWIPVGDSIPTVVKYVPSAYDLLRNAVWVWAQRGSYRLQKYDVASDSWTEYAADYLPAIDSTGAIDPTRDLFVVTEFRATHQVLVKDLTDPDQKALAVQTVGDKEIEQHAQIGFEWMPLLGKFVAWSSGNDLYTLTPPAQDWQNQDWQWQKITLSGQAPPDPVNGPYSKFQLAPNLGIALVATTRTSPVYAVRLVEAP